jgi:simple sugar transport system substrate-binding protein
LVSLNYLLDKKLVKEQKLKVLLKHLCMIQEAYNTALVDRCEGYGSAVSDEND